MAGLIGKAGKINLQPILFNGLAVAFVLLLLPISIAVVSNASVGDVEYSSALREGYYADGAGSWRSNGANYTDYYQQLDSNAVDGAFSCGYILPGPARYTTVEPDDLSYTFGSCEGDRSGIGAVGDFGDNYVFNNATQINSEKFIWMPQIENAGQTPVSDYSNHLGGNFFDNYPIQWGINSYANHLGALNIEDNDPINSIRILGYDSSDTYGCDSGVFDNVTAKYSLILTYGGSELKLTGFSNSYFNGLENVFLGDCSSYMELIYDFDTVQMLQLEQFTGGDYANMSMIIEINDIDFNGGSIIAPFWGSQNFELYVDYSTNPVEEVRGVIRPATFALGLIIGYIAIASTPYYDPLRLALKGAIE